MASDEKYKTGDVLDASDTADLTDDAGLDDTLDLSLHETTVRADDTASLEPVVPGFLAGRGLIGSGDRVRNAPVAHVSSVPSFLRGSSEKDDPEPIDRDARLPRVEDEDDSYDDEYDDYDDYDDDDDYYDDEYEDDYDDYDDDDYDDDYYDDEYYDDDDDDYVDGYDDEDDRGNQGVERESASASTTQSSTAPAPSPAMRPITSTDPTDEDIWRELESISRGATEPAPTQGVASESETLAARVEAPAVIPSAQVPERPATDSISAGEQPASVQARVPSIDEATDEAAGDTPGSQDVPTSESDGADDFADAPADAGKWYERHTVRIAIITVAVLALLCGVYAWGYKHYEGKFLPRTTINGLDVAGCTPEEARMRLEDETANYAVTVTAGGYSGLFQGTHISLSRDEESMVQQAWPEVDVRTWILRLVAPQAFVVDAHEAFDEAVLRDVVFHSVDDYNEMVLPASGALITYNTVAGAYALSGSTSGTAVSKEAVADAVVSDVAAFNNESNPDPSVALHAASVEDIPSFAYAVVRANLVRSHDVSVLVNGEQVYEIPAELNAEWVTVDDSGTPRVAVDTDAIESWADENLPELVFHQDDWSNYYLDAEAFAERLAANYELGITDAFEAPTTEVLRTEGESRARAYEKGGWDSSLGRYIDVDLESQFVRLFDETGKVLWESACVSGDMLEDHSTVTGVYEIYAHETGVTLVGLDYNNDGKPDYESYVNFWMPFYGGYGLHDATWRYEFGGDLYYYDGSHGCVNLPYNKAEELFGITYVGEKVNVHW